MIEVLFMKEIPSKRMVSSDVYNMMIFSFIWKCGTLVCIEGNMSMKGNFTKSEACCIGIFHEEKGFLYLFIHHMSSKPMFR